MRVILLSFLLISTTSIAQASSSNLPDESFTRDIRLKSTSVESKNPFGTFHVPNRSGIQEILDALHVTEPLDPAPPTKGGFGDVYFTKSYAIKITLSPDHTQETKNLLSLKISQNSSPQKGFYLSLPKVIYTPSYGSVFFPTTTQHVYISERLYPVKSMENVVKDALTTGSQGDLDLGYSFAFRLAEFQTNKIRKSYWDGIYYGPTHTDLNLRNIFPMSRPEHGVPGAFALIDCADVQHTASNAKPISIDMIYFLMKTQAFLPYFHDYNMLPHDVKNERMKAFIHYIFLGYFAGHKHNVRRDLRDFYLSDTSYLEAMKNKYTFGNNIALYRTFHNAINSAYQTLSLPPQHPILPPEFDTEQYIILQGFSGLPELTNRSNAQRYHWATCHFRDFGLSEGRQYLITPRGFNVETYKNANRDLSDHVRFYVSDAHKNLWLIGHYYYSGKNEGRPYIDGLPTGFKPENYLHLNKDLISTAFTQGCKTQGLLHSFAYDHYYTHGRAEGRPYLTNLPQDFDPLAYLNANNDLLIDARKTCHTQGLLKTYAYEHYDRDGRREGRAFLAPYPVGFSPDTYLHLNRDLYHEATKRGFKTLEERRIYAHQHYYYSGYNEGRPYLTGLPVDFTADNYLFLNQDLVLAAESTGHNTIEKKRSFAFQHYETYGRAEGRNYLTNLPQDFDPLVYLNKNPLILNIAKQSCKTEGLLKSYAYDHYNRYGKNEGRPYR